MYIPRVFNGKAWDFAEWVFMILGLLLYPFPCIRTYIHTYTYICTHTYICTFTHTYTCTYTHTYTCTYTHTYTHMLTTYICTLCTCTHTCTYIHMHTQHAHITHTHIHVHTCIHTHRHMHTHTYTQRLQDFMHSILRLAKFALNAHRQTVTDTDLYEDFSEEERKPLLLDSKRFMNPATFDQKTEVPPHLFSRGTSVETQNWLEEFSTMNLPSFSMQYIQLIHVPLDVMRECLKLQVELGKDVKAPSAHTVKQVKPV